MNTITTILSQSDKEFQILILCFKYYMSCMCYKYWWTDLVDDMIMLKICIWGVPSMILGQNTGYSSQVFVISLHPTGESLRSQPLPLQLIIHESFHYWCYSLQAEIIMVSCINNPHFPKTDLEGYCYTNKFILLQKIKSHFFISYFISWFI